MRNYILLILVFAAMKSYCQEDKKKFPQAIEDNSFLIEEAYNQEDRVVQHISNDQYFPDTHSFLYTFTQEWPITSYKHQLSYTLPYSFLNSNQYNGIGDIMINYRYQWFYNDDWACVSPRLSIIIPTGDNKKGLGEGVWGAQISLPVSKILSEHFVMHFNLCGTRLFNVKRDFDGISWKKDIVNSYAGLSLIYLTTSKLNFMLEALNYHNGDIDMKGKIIYTDQYIVNPGIRYAININKLQIVPGISVPFTMQEKEKLQVPIFFYLSFEHPF